MVREDYILRTIEEIVQMIIQVDDLQEKRRYREAFEITKDEIHKLAGIQAEDITRLTDTELLARLINQEPTIVGHYKIALLAFLLKKAGDLSERLKEPNKSYYLIGVTLLLELFASNEEVEGDEIPKITVEEFMEVLQNIPLPIQILASLMEYYESKFQFSKAENAFNNMIQINPNSSVTLNMGIAFYKMLQSQNDATLKVDNFSRERIDFALNQLCAKMNSTRQP